MSAPPIRPVDQGRVAGEHAIRYQEVFDAGADRTRRPLVPRGDVLKTIVSPKFPQKLVLLGALPLLPLPCRSHSALPPPNDRARG